MSTASERRRAPGMLELEELERSKDRLVLQSALSCHEPAFLADHRVGATPVFPAVMALELLARAAARLLGPSTDGEPCAAAAPMVHAVTDCIFNRQLLLPVDGAAVTVICECDRDAGRGDDLAVRATLSTEKIAPSSGIRRRLRHASASFAFGAPAPELVDELQARVPTFAGPSTRLDRAEVYGSFVPFGPAFHNLSAITIYGTSGAHALLGTPHGWPAERIAGNGFIRDAAIHAACCLFRAPLGLSAIPVSVESLVIHRATVPDETYHGFVVPRAITAPARGSCDVFIVTTEHVLCEALLGLHMAATKALGS